ncbi:hypothetical protein HZ994_18660 [Akkermansiaceae bacterium]|nr:hypothetical protein HZ994_18660 [Akkermansiaceae bacterium]
MGIRGYLPHSAVKALVFWILTACTAAATLAGILQSWGAIGREIANRCLWTAFILAMGSIAFLVINCVFGDLGQAILGKDIPQPNIDPAFRERLKTAKTQPPQGGQG